MKNLLTVFVVITLVSSASMYAEESVFIHPTLPGSDFRDYSKPSTIVRGDRVYETLPGSNFRDYSKPGMKIEGNMIYQTRPGSDFRDYSKPGMKIEGNMIYPTRPGSTFRDYSKPGKYSDGNTVYPTLPGSSFRDYSKAGEIVDGEMVYPTLPGSDFRDHSKPGWRIEGNRKDTKHLEGIINAPDVMKEDEGNMEKNIGSQESSTVKPNTQSQNAVPDGQEFRKPKRKNLTTIPKYPEIERRDNILYLPVPSTNR